MPVSGLRLATMILRYILFCCPLLLLLLLLRLVYLVWRIRRKRAGFTWPSSTRSTASSSKKKSDKPRRTLIVLGSGGHTSEMIQLIKNLSPEVYQPRIFVKAATDATSVGRLQAAGVHVSTPVYEIPRAREVGQSYSSSVSSTLYAFFFAIRLIGRSRPHVLLCNGPGTCLPLCVAAFGWRLLGWTTTRVIFVESYCRVQTMSLTGRLLYPWVDLCAVHWPTLQDDYPLTQLVSTMIRHDNVKKGQ